MTKGAVAAGHPLTAGAAESILQAGGNAFDAVLSALAAACVVEPVLASLGGGGFLLARPAGEASRVYDFFVQTPCRQRAAADTDFRAIEADFGGVTQEFHIGHGAIATPGLVRGLFQAHADLGRMPIRDIVTPAVRHAREGIRITDFQSYIMGVVAPIYTVDDTVLEVFGSQLSPGDTLRTGEILQLPEMADVLESLASEGPDLFYLGEIGQRLTRDLADSGYLCPQDLAAYEVYRREPLRLDYRGARLEFNPPPASGGLLSALTLNLLSGVPLEGLRFGSLAHLQRLVRAMAVTNSLRREHRLDNGESTHATILEGELASRYRHEIAGVPVAARGTTHISVVDAAGNMAALTTSNGEGAGYLIPGTGIMMNNMLGEDDLNPGGFHRWAPNVRMTSMMSPVFATLADGTVIVSGSGGSNRIRSVIPQVLSNMLDFGMAAQAAVDAPRLHLEGAHLNVEGGYTLEELGGLFDEFPDHQCWDHRNLFFGGAHSVLRRGSEFEGAGDGRRGGVHRIVV